MDAEKYNVTLMDSEREKLEEIIKKRNGKSLPVKRAYILLAADKHREKCWADIRIAETYGVGSKTVERTRQRFVEDGFEAAVRGKEHYFHWN